MRTLELDAEAGAVLPARDTMLVINIAGITSRVQANAHLNAITAGLGNTSASASGATVSVSQTVNQTSLNIL